MSTIYSSTFSPKVGETVELPSKIGRIDCERIGSPDIGYGTLKLGVTGSGEMSEFVLLRAEGNEVEIEDDAQILCTDVARGSLWYAVEISQYGGKA